MTKRLQVRRVFDLLLVVVLLGPFAWGDSRQPTSWTHLSGRSLASALDELRGLGLPILYSDAIVRPDMIVRRDPASSDPRDVLEEILEDHHLGVREMPDGQLVIIPASISTGTIVIELDLPSGHPRVATAEIKETGQIVRTSGGTAEIQNVPEGTRTITVTVPGYIPRSFEVEVREGDTAHLTARLEPILHLEQIVVMPDQLSLRHDSPAEAGHLSETEIEITPHVGDDLMRAVAAAPGVSESDFSAKFNPRGGGDDETLVMLDGVELYEPFHLKDFLSIFSIIDSEVVDQVDLLTGAFTADYGDRMSAVMDISIQNATTPGTGMTLGTLNSRLFSTGRFHTDGDWLVTARGWYPTALPDSTGFLEGQAAADYFDVLARIRYPITRRTTIAAGLLGAFDDLSFRESDEIDRSSIDARYASQQSWVALDGAINDELSWRSTASITNIDRDRKGEEIDSEDGNLFVLDDRGFRSIDARSDWSWNVDDRHLLRWGGGLRLQDADYDYSRSLTPPGEDDPQTVEVDLAPDGTGYNAWISDRFRLGERVVAEIGIRWDYQDWTVDSQISPRANLKIDLTPRTELRLGWGRFHQSQRLNELAVEDGFTQFHEAEFSRHSVLSIMHSFENDWTLRGVVYEKEFDQLRPRYENLFSQLELFPESRPDRVLVRPERGEARGLELVLRNGLAHDVSWWIGYTRTEALDIIDGRSVPRSWDQKHTVSGGLAFDLPFDVEASFGGTWHSGRPTTPISVELEEDDGEIEAVIVPGARNTARLGNYHRLDLRLSRELRLRNGTGRIVLQTFNLTNRKNVCYIEDFQVEIEDGTVLVEPEEQLCSPIIPTLSLGWRF